MRGKTEYPKDLERRMYVYFASYSEPGLPSFSKFARMCGMTLEDLSRMRRRKRFDAAWRECTEIRRDYLIDTALSKRADASFAKFLYSLEFPTESVGDGSNEMNVTLEVLDG